MATAVIGYSHAKALKHAPNAGPGGPLDVRRCYFLRGGYRIEPAGPDGPLRLVATGEEMDEDPLRLEDFDTLVLSAAGWRAARNEVVETDGPALHPLGCMACASWGFQPERLPGVRLVSAAVFDATVEAWLRVQNVVQLARDLVQATESRIIVQPWPAPNRVMKADPDWVINRWYGVHGPAAWRVFFIAQQAALRRLVAEIGPRVVLLDYPLADTLEDGFTDSAFGGTDLFHGNLAYGALVIDQIAAHMAGKRGGEPAIA